MRKAVNRVPLTARGAALLKAELIRLKQEERPKLLRPLPKRARMGIYLKMRNIMLQKSAKVS